MKYCDEILPGTRVMVFDSRLFKDDKSTPLSYTIRLATVICRYGYESKFGLGKYPDLVNVIFDHKPNNISRGHFTDGIRKI